jgi:hypothetical protein
MRTDEVQGASELARLTLKGAARRVQEVHQGVAERVFRAVGPAPSSTTTGPDATLTAR